MGTTVYMASLINQKWPKIVGLTNLQLDPCKNPFMCSLFPAVRVVTVLSPLL